MLVFYVPPGIGDFSAMYSKLCNVGREIIIRPSLDGPQRLGPFLDLLPKVKNGSYACHGTMASVVNTLPSGTDLREIPDGDYFLSINQHLEEGNRVEDWIPGETTFHYDFQIPHIDKVAALKELASCGEAPKIGVYTSAYGNSRHWGFWDWEMWRDFLKAGAEEVPKETVFIFIGAEYDLAISEYAHKWMGENGYNSLDLVGKLEIGGTIEVIRELDYLFSFPSGIGFLADVVNTPNTMWFPSKLNLMRYTFVDPINIELGKTIHLNFDIPEDSAEQFVKGPGLLQFYRSLRKRGYPCHV